MDNNNLGQPGMGQASYPPMQPNMQNMNGMPNQPMYPQPMMKPPKQPMDPVKKKKLILGFSIGGAVLALGIAVAIIVPILLRVDYAPTYTAAKELKPKVYSIYQSYDCGYVVDYVDSTYTSTKTYNGYIENCKAVYNAGADEAISKLENTDGVKRNNEISAQFSKFKNEYAAISAGDSESLDAKLELYKAWHNFVHAKDDLNYSSSSDAEIRTAANYLIDSGNETLKTYGEGWLEKTLAAAAAYRAYNNASWSASNYSELKNDYYNKRNEQSDWVATNKPDIKSVAPLNFNDASKMYNEFSTLYDLIAKTYARNYNSGSGDCTEFLGEVYCD